MATELSTHERIRDEALKLFATRGYAATGIRDIAEAAGLRTASLYHYMGTKEELLLTLMLDGNRRLLAAGELVAGDNAQPEWRLAALVHLHVLLHAHHRVEAIVLDAELRSLSPDAREQVVAVRDRYEDVWKRALDDGVLDGVFDVPNPGVTRLGLITMCTGVAYWYSPERGGDDALARTLADTALGAVRARRDGRAVRAGDPGMPSPDDVRTPLASFGMRLEG